MNPLRSGLSGTHARYEKAGQHFRANPVLHAATNCAQTFLLPFAVSAFRIASFALRIGIDPVWRLRADDALLERVCLVVMLQRALSESKLQLKILDLVNREAGLG